ncbi:UDP-N-acetylglucosamine-peptide N-acetylglucosaminyltransferase [Acrasis kona]|uniref:UDP-N-acetylglucosamine-peptide N-acetylglucosaminyltransferase n=1 Tax=Acrasis kona TaxID=1008807 RepID=A0AAW2Z2Q6_9EUKA
MTKTMDQSDDHMSEREDTVMILQTNEFNEDFSKKMNISHPNTATTLTNQNHQLLRLQIQHSLSIFQNVSQSVSISALRSLVDAHVLEQNVQLFKDWNIYAHIIVLTTLLATLSSSFDPDLDTFAYYGVHKEDLTWTLEEFERQRQAMLRQVEAEETSYCYMRRAMLLRFEFKPKQANKCFKRSVELNQHSYESIYSRAMIALRLNKPIDYLKQLNLALFVCERDIALMDRMPRWFDQQLVIRAKSFKHSIRGRMLIKRKLYASSLKEYKSAVQVDCTSMYAHFYLGFYYSFEGREKNDELSTKHFMEALRFTGVERRDVYASLIYDNLGQVFESADRFEEALRFYTRSLEANPRYGWGYQNRALLLPEMNRYNEAVNDNTQCIEFEPEMDSISSDLYAERARSYFNLSENEKCINDLIKAKSLDPTLEYPYVMLSYLEIGDEAKALQLIEEGIRNCRGESADLLSVLGRKYWFYSTVVNDYAKAQEAKRVLDNFEKSHFRIE